MGNRSAPAVAECLVTILSADSPTRVWPAAPRILSEPGEGGGVNSTPSLSLRILWVLVKYLTSKVGTSYLPEKRGRDFPISLWNRCSRARKYAEA